MADRKRTPATPIGGVPTTAMTTVPRDEFSDDPKSGVHGETALDAIERRQRTQLSTAQTTLETLHRHDSDIKELKTVTTDIKIETEKQSETLVEVVGKQNEFAEKQDEHGRILEIATTKLDTMLTILDPAAPDKIKKIVHETVDTTTFMREAEEQKAVVSFKRRRQLIVLKTLLGVAGAFGVGLAGYLFHSCQG